MSAAPLLFDRRHVARNLYRRSAEHPDFIMQLVLDDLADRLATISRTFTRALILAPDITHLPAKLDTAEGPVNFSHRSTLIPDGEVKPLNPEELRLARNDYDLIISLFDLAFTNDVPGFLSAIHNHLKPDGLMMAAFVGGTSLNELRSAWLNADSTHKGGAVARVAPFIDTRDAGGLLQRSGYALPVADIEPHMVRYATPLNLMAEIKALGGANPLAGRHPGLITPAHLASAIDAYAQIAGDPDGRVRATLELIWLSGWTPHESQQKPLKPGSAKTSLKQALKPKDPN